MRPRDLFWLGSGLAVGFALGAALPRLRREFGPVIQEAGSRAGEMASELTSVIMDHLQRVQEQHAEQAASPPPERAAS